MRILAHCLFEALWNLVRDWRRLLPMALGIVWGMASVMVLLAIANGFERSQKRALDAYGDRFILLRLNRAELTRAAGGEERRLMMDVEDVNRLRLGAPAIRRLSPMVMAYRARVTAHSGAGTGVRIAGALPELARLRSLPLAEGRFYDEIDDAERRRVIVLGPIVRRQLFGKGPAIGRTVRVAGFSTSQVPQRTEPRQILTATRRGAGSDGVRPSRLSGPAAGTTAARSQDVSIQGELFEVIGVLADVEMREESYVSVARMAFIPFSTAAVVFDTDYNTIFIEPRSIADRELALRQFNAVMGSRYGFEPDDQNAVLVYFDSIERARSIASVFGTLKVFLGLAGAGILAVGALGVMNVVLVSVAARRFEIGVRKALGATPAIIQLQFFAETLLGCLLSGAIGFLAGAAGISLLSVVPLPDGFSRPALDVHTAFLALGLLTLIAVIAGVYPARRAARLTPVEALQ